ncbi:MAG: histidine phosphatase family protein [Microbacteriaceae bacterium]|nr:histidine phosphatase family protein [Microbacteriaceae bacterium]HOB56733.1 histidine phosphatase family protein [Rhodoglobus sp.]HOY82440.1 histidine phosphatase family protein [Rhodoglobus sp.]HPG74991.1 histidine phosphatase family protein [Rhodoglobus sp.]HPM51524.1 histidine phosphatase family protein [Rhodoglobus sp.]
MRLLLIRHGQTPSNVDGLLDTARPGPGLTELGERQAAEIPDALKHEAIDGIYVSVLRRTLITATPLIVDRGLDPVELPGIHEIEAGDLEMRHDHEAYRIYLETAFAWGMGDLDRRMPGATDGHEFFRRFDESIASVTGNNAVVFSHGAAIRVWVAGRAINVPPSFAGEHDIQNTGVVELDGSLESGFTLLSWQGTPVGGSDLSDDTAEDPTGETLDEARAAD